MNENALMELEKTKRITETIFYENVEIDGEVQRRCKIEYLEFLRFNGGRDRIQKNIDCLKQIIATTNELQLFVDISLIFEQCGWRPHLVACVAILLLDNCEEYLDSLWLRIEKGSWVSPQLVATALLVDRDFIHKANLLLSDKDTYSKSMLAIARVLRTLNHQKQFSEQQLKNLASISFLDRDAAADYIAVLWLSNVCDKMQLKNTTLAEMLPSVIRQAELLNGTNPYADLTAYGKYE